MSDFTGVEQRVAVKDRREAERRVVTEGFTGDERRVGTERRVVERRSHAVDVAPVEPAPVEPAPVDPAVDPVPPVEIPAWDGVERRVATAPRRGGVADRRIA